MSTASTMPGGRYAAPDQQRASGAELIRTTWRSFGRTLFIAFVVTAGCNLTALLVPLYIIGLFSLVISTLNTNTLVWLSVGLAFGLGVFAALEYTRAVLY